MRIAVGAAVVALVAAAAAPATLAGKIESRVLSDTAAGRQGSFLVQLREQADLSAAYGMRDQDARGWYVYRTLKAEAERTQGPLRELLRARGARFTAYWAANVIAVQGDRALVDELAARPDVGAIEANDVSRWLADDDFVPAFNAFAALAPRTVEPGVAKVHAPDLWALGFTGQGIVIGNQDTGIRWTHEALKPHYRGWNGSSADHNYNWHDSIHASIGGQPPNPCGYDSLAPCDDNGHGTHTTGTAVGDDGSGNQIGVAPGAKWIGCRNMDQGSGRPQTYTECFQWFIAPTDSSNQSPNPELRPHVINNSWGCPEGEGCAWDTLQTVVQNVEAAGIFVEGSAGNSGPLCNTVSAPPAIYDATFTTGAMSAADDRLANFSSRGPVLVDNSFRLKPDVVAPGVNVRSSYFTGDSAFVSLSGTSMAGPHVVGVVALLWSARPDLVRNVAATKALLQATADPHVVVSPAQTCHEVPSSRIPNNSFGYGLVDALAAYRGVAPPPPPPPPPPPRRCVVPRVVGQRLAAAKTRIRRAHCRVGRITRVRSSARRRNRVLAQSPRPGRLFAAGHRVRLRVGKGPRAR